MSRKLNIKFEQIDWWGKVMYKVEDKQAYLTSTETLFPNDKIAPNKTNAEINNYFKNNLDELVIHGSNIEDDTLGSKIGKGWKINIIQ